MGKAYFYGKIISILGNSLFKGNGLNGIMKYTMVSEMLKGNSGNVSINSMIPLMMLSGGKTDNMFDGLFDFDLGLDDESDTDEDDADEGSGN